MLVTWLNLSLPEITAASSPFISPACNARSQHGNRKRGGKWRVLRKFRTPPQEVATRHVGPHQSRLLKQQPDMFVIRNQNFM